MHLPKLYSLLQDLKHPGNVWERRQLRTRIRTFLDSLPKWREASHLSFIGRGFYSISYSFIHRNREYVIRISSAVSAFTHNSFASRYADRSPCFVFSRLEILTKTDTMRFLKELQADR